MSLSSFSLEIPPVERLKLFAEDLITDVPRLRCKFQFTEEKNCIPISETYLTPLNESPLKREIP